MDLIAANATEIALFGTQGILYKMLVAAALGLITVVVHSIFLNSWLRHLNNLAIAAMLPAVALVITQVISTNLMLSLGMIGALSIIRYRTPVKSTYELGILFTLITLGISAGVNPKYAYGLCLFICGCAPFFWLVGRKLPAARFLHPGGSGVVECVVTGAPDSLRDELRQLDKLKSYERYPGADGAEVASATFHFQRMSEALEFESALQEKASIESVSIRHV